MAACIEYLILSREPSTSMIWAVWHESCSYLHGHSTSSYLGGYGQNVQNLSGLCPTETSEDVRRNGCGTCCSAIFAHCHPGRMDNRAHLDAAINVVGHYFLHVLDGMHAWPANQSRCRPARPVARNICCDFMLNSRCQAVGLPRQSCVCPTI